MYNSNLQAYKKQIDALTQIDKDITKQKFYEVSLPDYMDIDTGNGAFMDSIFKWNTTNIADDGFSGFNISNTNNARMPEVSVALNSQTDLRYMWNKYVSYNIKDLEQLKNTGNFDLISEKMEARKKNFDLMVQRVAFLGNKVFEDSQGLLNQSKVNVNTTIITKSISSMSPAEMQVLASTLLQSYYANSNNTQMPNRFTIPASDYNGLGTPSDPNFQLKSKLEYLLDAFRTILEGYGVKDFKILPSAYADNLQNGTGNQIYALYHKDINTFVLDLPVEFTTTAFNTYNNYDFQNVGYGQVGGVRLFRPQEMLYYTFAA